MAAIFKNIKCDMSQEPVDRLVKYGMAMHIRPPNLTVDQKFQNFKI